MSKLIQIRGKLSGPDIQLIIHDLYETYFEIHDQITDTLNPLSSVLVREVEDVGIEELIHSSVSTYIDNDFNNVYKLSLAEYLNLPKYVINILTSLAITTINNRANAMGDIDKMLKDK